MLTWAKASGQAPLWALVPDVVADRKATLCDWRKWAPVVARYGWPLAFAVQDGMTTDDVPSDVDVIFVGGSTRWKRRTLHVWCDRFPRVHIGRINTEKWLWVCDEAGAESCDGTGWYRGDQQQLAGLEKYLFYTANGYTREQRELFVRARAKALRQEVGR